MFDPFAQAEQDTAQRFGGTGLGVGIIGRLVPWMEGSIEAFSALEHGSRVRIRLPNADGATSG